MKVVRAQFKKTMKTIYKLKAQISDLSIVLLLAALTLNDDAANNLHSPRPSAITSDNVGRIILIFQRSALNFKTCGVIVACAVNGYFSTVIRSSIGYRVSRPGAKFNFSGA